MPLLIMLFMSKGSVLEFVKSHTKEMLLSIDTMKEMVNIVSGSVSVWCPIIEYQKVSNIIVNIASQISVVRLVCSYGNDFVVAPLRFTFAILTDPHTLHVLNDCKCIIPLNMFAR